MKLSLALATALVSLLLTTAVSAQNVCIDEKAKQALACSGAAAKEIAAAALRAGPGFRAVAAPDIRFQARATLGRAHANLGASHASQARAEYARARSLWSDAAAAELSARIELWRHRRRAAPDPPHDAK